MISGVKRAYEVPMAFVVMKLYLACRCCWMYRVKIAWLLDDWSFMLVLAVVRLKAPLFRQDIVSSSDRTARVVTPTWKKTKDKLTVWMSDYPGSHLVHFFYKSDLFVFKRTKSLSVHNQCTVLCPFSIIWSYTILFSMIFFCQETSE